MTDNKTNKALLFQYAGIGGQLLVGLLIAVFLGKWIDAKVQFRFPVFIWLLPLIVIIGMILKAIKDTSKKIK